MPTHFWIFGTFRKKNNKTSKLLFCYMYELHNSHFIYFVIFEIYVFGMFYIFLFVFSFLYTRLFGSSFFCFSYRNLYLSQSVSQCILQCFRKEPAAMKAGQRAAPRVGKRAPQAGRALDSCCMFFIQMCEDLEDVTGNELCANSHDGFFGGNTILQIEYDKLKKKSKQMCIRKNNLYKKSPKT